MKKVIRDGKVAVLVSPGFGAGWYTWHLNEQLLFDPVVVGILEDSTTSKAKKINDIETYVSKEYEDEPYTGGVDGLCVQWVTEGAKFYIQEYDGSENLLTLNDEGWLVA